MSKHSTREELLAAAQDDGLFQKELSIQSGKESAEVLEALKAGLEHPKSGEVLDWIGQLVRECRDPIAQYTAKQDHGRYSIKIFGFDCLCQVWTPEYGVTSPFASHEAAMTYVEWNWGEFLIDSKTKIVRFPPEKPDATSPLAAFVKEISVARIRYRIGDAEYSNIELDLYQRYKRRYDSGDKMFTTQQLVVILSSQHGTEQKELELQIKATGWQQVADEFAHLKSCRQIEAAEAARIEQEAYTAEVVIFIDKFLAGREDLDGKLVDAGALKWSWRKYENIVIKDDESNFPNTDYLRQDYYRALKAYAAAKKIAGGKR